MDYFTIEYLSTMGGMVLAVGLIVEYTKGFIKNSKYSDGFVRLYALVWAITLQGALLYINYNITAESALLAFLNAMLVTAAVTGAYEVVTDIRAEK